MSYQLTFDPHRAQPGGGAGQHGLVPLAPSQVGAPLSLPQVDTNPYLSTPRPHFSESVISVADLIGYLKRFGLLGFLLALPAAAAVFYLLGMGANVYESEAKLRLRLQDTNVFNFNEMGRQGVTELSAPQLINNHLTELKSRRFVDYFYDHFDPVQRDVFIADELSTLGRKDQLLKMVGMYEPSKPAPPMDVFAESIDEWVRVEPQKESHILRILVRNRDPKMAADIANGFAQEYIRFFGEQESGQTQSERDYLQTKADELRKRLEVSERELAAYSKSENLMQADAAQDVGGDKVRQLMTAITNAEIALAKAKSDVQSIRATQQAGRDLLEVRLVADNPDVAFNRKEMDAAMAERKALEPLCGRRHPQMIALAGRIESSRRALDQAAMAVVTMAEAEVANQERQIADFQKQLQASRGDVLDQSGKNVQQKMLSDQVAADREMYQTIVKRLNQAEVTGNFKDSGALSLSDIASTPDKPVKPNKPVAAVASLIIFVCFFLGLPVGWGLFDDHVLKLIRQNGSPSANIPSVKEVPHIPTGHTRPLGPAPVNLPSIQPSTLPQAQAQVRTSLFGAAAAAPEPSPLVMQAPNQAPVVARLPLIGHGNPETMLGQLLQPEPHGAAGALSQLTTTLEMQALKRSGMGGIILLTSAEAGEGKTLSAAALAAAFCHQGRSVFMMECNAVSPTLHQWFPHASHHSSWAHDLESLRYGKTNLFLLPAHDLPAYATNELLDGYRSWIDRARQQVDWIILDGGPILKNFADVAPLAPLATDVLIVNNPSVSNPAKLRAAMNLLQPMMSSSAFRGMIVHGAS
ncbi:hypothetical protein WJU23_00840 [Prosthecobacter sp. SYSU 5D2]|uniref:exopolysaccharide transport family protein n=1 Tax=Prosthecobacter sp. SYSU 5D2 TaxID=3134134 RepID=UPI0031FEEDC3